MLESLVRRLGRRPPPEPAELVIHRSQQQPQRQSLPGACYRIGRDRSNDVVIDHGAVSRRHALLERRGPCWLLRDNGSTNGLWWQGRRVQELVLRSGDRVQFGPIPKPGLPELGFEEQGAPRRRRLLDLTLLSLLAVSGGGLLLLLSALTLPIRGSLATVRGPLVLYDRQDRPMASADDRRHRELARLGDYPKVLVDALLASEDSRFWQHPGVDPVGTARALLVNLAGGRVLEGGSTLTQQLARSLYPDQVGQGETLGRKWRELLVDLQLEARFSKHDLLLSYLNRAYLGAGWGFEDASRRLFAKPAAQLESDEAALLVGLLPSPNGFNPCVAPEPALRSRNRVLAKMVDTGRLSADAGRSARRRPIRLAPGACRVAERRAAPYYSDQVRRDLDALVGADVAAEGNFLVDTHLDPALQELVERLLRQRLERNPDARISQGAVVVLDSRNGGVLAIAGGRDYGSSQFNRASMALRQPGSTFKLIPYLVALERGARPGDPVRCGSLEWQGQRFESGCGGSLSLRQALAISSNTAALRTARQVGLDAVVQKARDLGITSPLLPVPGLVLGQSEVTLLELTAAYGAVAADGVWHAPTTIRRLTDAERCDRQDSARVAPGERQRGGDCRSPAAARRSALTPGRRVLRPETARAMQSMLRAVVNGGTGTAAWIPGGVGGKTGTTNDARDLLFVGFDPRRHWVMGIWLGNDDNSPTRASSALAAALWGEIMRSAPAPD